MIFDILEKSTGLKASGIKKKQMNLKNFETSLKNYIGDKLDTKYNELYNIYKSRNHSASSKKIKN